MTAPQTPPPARSLSPHAVLWLLAGAYALIYALFWPRAYAIMDESVYMNAAYALRHGTVYIDQVGVNAIFAYPVGPHTIVQYPPGMPALLAGVSLLGWGATLATNLFAHLFIFFLLTRILRHLNIAPAWAALYLLHPTAVVYSRTVMSDLPSCLLVTAAFLLYLRRQFVWVGVLMGLAITVRTASGVALPLFMLAAFLDPAPGLARDSTKPVTLWERLVPPLLMGLGAAPLAVGAWLYQAIIQQGGWAKYSGNGQFGLHNFPHVFPRYVMALLVVFPGMLVAPLLYRGTGRAALLCLTYGFVFFYSCYYYGDATDSKIETFILGQRYMLSVVPLFVVAYAQILTGLLARVASPVLRRVLPVVGVATLFGLAGVVHAKHQSHLIKAAGIRAAVVASVPPGAALFCNSQVAKLLHPAWTGDLTRYTLIEDNGVVEPIARALVAQKKVYVAAWSRDYRAETGKERGIMDIIYQRFDCRPVPASLPDDVVLFEVLRARPATEKGAVR